MDKLFSRTVRSEKQPALSDESILEQVFRKYYYSSVLAIVCSSIGQIAGNIVIGNVHGEEKLAVMSLVLPIYYIFATIGNFAGIGGSALCAQWIGKRADEKSKKAYTVTYLLTVLLCIVFGGLTLLFLPQIVRFLGTPEELYHDVESYTAIMAYGGLSTAGVYLSFNFLRLDGKGFDTVLTFAMMSVVTVILDILLAFMGVTGIAIATVAGNVAATVFGVLRTARGKVLGFVRVSFREFGTYSGQIFKIGSPGATENVSILLKSYLLNQIISSIVGTAALSTLSVVNSINSFANAITVGGAGAIVPMVGVFVSEKDTVSIRRSVRSALRVSGIFLLFFCVVILIFAGPIAGFFGITNDSVGAEAAIRLFVLSLPISLFANFLIYLHLANHHTILSNILTAVHSFVWMVVGAYVLMLAAGATGLWLSFALCEAATLLTALILHWAARLKDPYLSPVLLLDTRSETDGTSIAITTTDGEADLSAALDRLREFCEANELSPKEAMITTLSMDEMVHMAADHSTRLGNQHLISIRVLIFGDLLVLRLRYTGEMFNPIEYYEEKKTDQSDVEAMLELADCLGIKMVTETCDVVDYRTTFGINNLTIITSSGKKA